MSELYKQGLNRNQQLLFPPSIDDYVDEDNNVRAIDSYVELLDLTKLQFSNTRKSDRADGQKAYSPKMLLKIYIYGYLNKIRSSRALEKECKRNLELIWLAQDLKPTYRTISEFRARNPKALKQVFKEFVVLCKNIDLIGDGLKAVDGAFLRANASKNQLILKKTLDKDLTKIETEIEEYLKSLEYADKEKQPSSIINKLPKDLRKLKYQQEELSKNLKLLEEMGKTQYNKTDSDASLMKKPAHNLMAYNSQIVVDDSFKFIVATDISTVGSDRAQLHKMAKETKENLGVDKLKIVADTGYYSAKEFKKCSEDNINAIVPLANMRQVQKDKGKFTRDEFIYNDNNDCYICPNNYQLKKRIAPQIKNDKVNFIYTGTSAICKACPLKDKCIPTKAPYKQIYRWEHEYITEAHNKKMQTEESKVIVKKRGSIVEHPFGTIKRTLGWDHYLVRGKEKVSGENALIMFSYNFKRLLNLIGINLFQKLMIALKDRDISSIKEEIAQYIANSLLYVVCFFRIYFMLKFKSRKAIILR
ncbi:IS1182 family transposase [Sulfurimonas sp.]|uniref:IS1182 family transposase n=1 Tax=Sulfurimonas sp. TaxID=2022749 RepID=UPI002AAF15FE|nr:IS1182 family transposase [Sulfurimonas sp.]